MNDDINPKYGAMIRLYVYSESISPEDAAKMIGRQSWWKPASQNVDYIWAYMTDPVPYEDSGEALRHFLDNDFLELAQGLDALGQKGSTIELYLDIGIKAALPSRIWPYISIDPESMKTLADHKIKLLIWLADQLT